MKSITHSIPVILTGLSLLAGCGSGQGQAPLPSPSPLTQISGKVAPGPVWNGRVTAWELDTGGEMHTELGWTFTDENGGYTLFLDRAYSGGVILLQVSSDMETRMNCPLVNGCTDVDFGEWMSLPSNFTINAVSSPKGERATANITPLTHMAAARVLSLGHASPEAVFKANSEISQMVGVHVLTTDIADISGRDGQPLGLGAALRHALFLSGMADYLTASGGTTFATSLQKLARAFQAGTLRSDMTRDIIDRVKHAMVDVTGILDRPEPYSEDMLISHSSLESIIATLGSRDYDPEPSEGADKSAVTQAKLLLSQARTFVMQILEHQMDPLSSMRMESVSVASFMGRDTHHLVRVLGETLGQILFQINPQGLTEEDIITVIDENQSILGEVIVSKKASARDTAWILNGDLWAESPILIRDFTLRTSLTSDSLADFDSLVNDEVFLFVDGHIGNEVLSIHFKDTGLTITVRDRNISTMAFKGAVTLRLADRTFSGEAELTWNASDGSLTAQDLSWTGMDNGLTTWTDDVPAFTSQALVSLEPVVDTDTIRFDASDIAVRGSKTIPYHDLSLTTRMILESYAGDCADEFDHTVSMAMRYPVQDRILLQCQGTDPLGLPLKNTLSFDLFQSLTNDLTRSIKEAYGGLLDPSQLKFHTEAFDLSPVIVLNYTLTPGDWDKLFISGHLTVTASTVIPDMPALTATLSVSRTHESGGSASITINYNGKNYTLYFESPDLTMGTLILSNPDGVKFVVRANRENYKESYGTVYVGNETVGHIQIANGIPLVRYVDGTFESLF